MFLNSVLRFFCKLFCKKRILFFCVYAVCLYVCCGNGIPFAYSQEPSFCWDTHDNNTIVLHDGSFPVWHYVYRQVPHDWVAAGEPRRVSGCYFDPVFGLNGEVLTTGATVWDNHQHHHGIWPSFPVVIVTEADKTTRTFDLWTDNTALKRDFIRFGEQTVRDNKALFSVENGWFVDANECIVHEKIQIVTYPIVTDATYGRYRMLDFSFEWQSAGKPVRLETGGRSFSSMTVRFAVPDSKPVIQSENGEIPDDQMRIEIPWLDYRTSFGSDLKRDRVEKPKPATNARELSVMIIPSSNNPPFHGGSAIRHYGMICSGWPGTDGAELLPGQSPVLLKYRVIIHEKSWSPEMIRESTFLQF